MKRIIGLLTAIIILLCFVLSGCDTPSSAGSSPTVEKIALFDKPYATVSATSLSASDHTNMSHYYYLEIFLENKGNEQLELDIDNVSVNGLNIPFEFTPQALLGKGGCAERLGLDCKGAFLWGMDKLESICFDIHLSTKYSKEDLSVTVPVKHKGKNGTLIQDGKSLFDKAEVSVQYKVAEGWPVFLVTNNSQEEVRIEFQDIFLNERRLEGSNTHWFDWNENVVLPGQVVAVDARHPSEEIIPTAEIAQVSFQAKLTQKGADECDVSETISFETPLSLLRTSYVVDEKWIPVFDDRQVRICLGIYRSKAITTSDLCIWICNTTDEEISINLSDLYIDGRKILPPDWETNDTTYYRTTHVIGPNCEEIRKLTTGNCGTPEMYGGIQTVDASISVNIGDPSGNATTTECHADFSK